MKIFNIFPNSKKRKKSTYVVQSSSKPPLYPASITICPLSVTGSYKIKYEEINCSKCRGIASYRESSIENPMFSSPSNGLNLYQGEYPDFICIRCYKIKQVKQ